MDPTTQNTKGEITVEGLSGFIKKLVTAFNKAGLDYAFTGALAASYYGVPRTTADIDILVAVPDEDAKTRLAQALRQTGLEVEEKTIDDAMTSGYKIATFKSKNTPYKIDIILSEQIRRRDGNIAEVDTFLQAPENLILAKLRMIKVTIDTERVAKDVEDVRSILRFTKVDVDVVRKQAAKDKTLDVWRTFTKS